MPNSPESEPDMPVSPPDAVPQPPAGRDRQPAVPAVAAVEQLTAELARLEDRYKRALADLDNYRKRAARDGDRRAAEARESVMRDWLDAVDSVERALVMQADGPCVEGLKAVLAQMNAVLARQGAQRLGAAGEPFDPALHEAIAVRASAGVPDRTIVAVERSGYALGDRVLRPALVVVARAPEHVE